LDYLVRIGSVSLIRRFGFLANQVGADVPGSIYEQLRQKADRPGVSFFGPRKAEGHVIGHIGKWRLTVNVSAAALSESAGMGKQRTISKRK
jgi:predicted transcriptional regulator of viral defense system